MSKELTGQATADQIAKWKEDYGDIFQYTVENKTAYLKTVSRDVYSLAASKVSTSPAKFNETIIEKSWLGGDEQLRKDDKYFFGLIDFVEELMDKKKGSLQKL